MAETAYLSTCPFATECMNLVFFWPGSQKSGRKAKENDCVNQFAHAHLAKRIAPGTVLFDLAQISIEVGVSQVR